MWIPLVFVTCLKCTHAKKLAARKKIASVNTPSTHWTLFLQGNQKLAYAGLTQAHAVFIRLLDIFPSRHRVPCGNGLKVGQSKSPSLQGSQTHHLFWMHVLFLHALTFAGFLSTVRETDRASSPLPIGLFARICSACWLSRVFFLL